MDSITLWIYVVMFLIVFVIALSAFRISKNYLKMKKPFVKSPKFRGRGILRDDSRFGSAVIVGLQKTAPDAGFIHLVSQNGILFKEYYKSYELEPDDALETAAGAERPVWRRKGVRYSDTFQHPENLKNENQILELAAKLEKQKIDKKVEVNEAATLKDQIMDILKEMKEQPKTETMKIVK